MADPSRLDDLRRRIQKDPASIAFAQLAEEHRRAGQFQEAVDVCRAGLERHPGYLSARVTLGRALVALGQVDQAQAELERVLEVAPENLAAIRGLADIYRRRGEVALALTQFRAALALAPNDPDLERTVGDLVRRLEPPAPPPQATELSPPHLKPIGGTLSPSPTSRPVRIIAALEQWLAVIHVARAQRSTQPSAPADSRQPG